MFQKIIFIFLFLISPFFLHAEPRRFLYEGDGLLSLQMAKSGKKLSVQFRNQDGSYQNLKSINAFVGIPASFSEPYSLRLLSLLDFLQDHFSPKKTLTVYSGFRSQGYNNAIRAKGATAGKTSYHIEGMAIDVMFPGVSSQKVWEYVKNLNYGGVGIYGGGEVHLDSGKPRFWTKATALPTENEDPQNRNIYLSPEYDFYQEGETMRLFFSAISNYPFGMKSDWEVVDEKGKVLDKVTMSDQKCVVINQRSETRSFKLEIPQSLPQNKNLFIRVNFCKPTYKKMPESILSRVFVIEK